MTLARGFRLSKGTKVVLGQTSDPKGLGVKLENALLEAGFDVAPFELARRSLRSSHVRAGAASGDGFYEVGNSETYAVTLMPAGVVVSMTYEYTEYTAATYYTSAMMRVVDLESERLLASYRVDGSQLTPISMDGAIANFVEELAAIAK